MKLEHAVAIAAPPDRLWSQVMDIPAAARCLPGAAAVTPTGTGAFKGTLLAQVGPVRLVLDGEVAVVTRETLPSLRASPRLAGHYAHVLMSRSPKRPVARDFGS